MLPLPSTELHVWPVHLNVGGGSEAFKADLSKDELDRAERFRFDKHRNAFIMSRFALRQLVQKYTGQAARGIQFVYGENGKPRLATSALLHFNVAHSCDIGLFAFLRSCDVGVDVEAIRPLADMNSLARQFFCAEECAEIESLPNDERDDAFFRCWTRKEAYIKATGAGLSIPLNQFRLTVRSQDAALLLHIDNDADEAAAWTLHDLNLGPRYSAAAAYRDTPKKLVLMDACWASDFLLEAQKL